MYVATHNIWDTDKATRIGQLVKQNSVLCAVQELGERDNGEYEDFRKGLGPDWFIANESSKVPFALSGKHLRLASSRECPPGFQCRGVLKLHDGNDFTPMRQLSWIITKSVTLPNLPPVAWINIHLQHRAWNGKERNPVKLEIRREFWWTGYELSQWVFVNFLKYGVTATIMGDYNRRKVDVPVMTPRQQHVAGSGIDSIYVAKGWGPKAAGVKVFPEKAKRINTPSDHPLIVGNLQFLMP